MAIKVDKFVPLTSAQGALADTAIQPENLALVATSGFFDDLTDKPTTLAGYGVDLGAEPFTPAGGEPSTVQDTLDGLVNLPPLQLSMFGASPAKTRLQNTPLLQAALDLARDTGRDWILPVGDFRTGPLTAYTSGKFMGRLVAENLNVDKHFFTVAPLPADITVLTGSAAATFANSLTITRGADKDTALAAQYGRVVTIANYGDEVPLNRIGGTLRWLETVVVHDTDGSFYPPYSQSKTLTWTAAFSSITSTILRRNVTVQDVRIICVDAVGTPGLESVVRVTRPNTTIAGGSVFNDGTNEVLQGFISEAAAHVSFVDCQVKGLLNNQTNYGFNTGGAVVFFIRCSQLNCRRGLDVHHGKQILVVGGAYPDGIGMHWGHGLLVTGKAFISSNPDNTAPFWVAGADVDVEDCDVRLRTDQYSVMAVRNDMSELRGRMTLRNCRIDLDCSANLATDRSLMAYVFNSSAGAWNFGRKIWAPDLIELSGNTIRQRGASFTGLVYVLNLFQGPTLTAQTAGVGGNGQINVRGNQWVLDAGLTVGGNQRLFAAISKVQGAWDEGGYKVVLEDMPCLYFRGFAASGIPDPVTPRVDVYTDRIGTLQWQSNFGLFKIARLGAETYSFKLGVGRPSTGAYTTPVGDEVEMKTGDLVVTRSFNFGSIADGGVATTTFSVAGVTIGDMVTCMMQSAAVGWFCSAICLTDGVVTLEVMNKTGATVDPPTSNFILAIRKT